MYGDLVMDSVPDKVMNNKITDLKVGSRDQGVCDFSNFVIVVQTTTHYYERYCAS